MAGLAIIILINLNLDIIDSGTIMEEVTLALGLSQPPI